MTQQPSPTGLPNRGRYYYVNRENENMEDLFSQGIHENCYGLFLCQQGHCRIMLENKSYEIQAGDSCVYMPLQFLKILEKSRDLKGIITCISLKEVRNTLLSINNVSQLINFRTSPCLTLSQTQFALLEHLIQSLILWQDNNAGRQDLDDAISIQSRTQQSLIDTIGFEMINIYNSGTPIAAIKQDRKEVIFQKFLLSLLGHYMREREVAFYAAGQCLTPRYFSAVIKDCTGKSAQQWIVEIVTDKMKNMLITSNMSIKEISNSFNFTSQSFFGKYFKQYVGTSPKEFRKQNLDLMQETI